MSGGRGGGGVERGELWLKIGFYNFGWLFVAVTCQTLSISHGILHWSASRDSNQDFTFGMTVYAACQKHYILEGSRERRCLAAGEWSGSMAHCERK